jgi:hypothetical protein
MSDRRMQQNLDESQKSYKGNFREKETVATPGKHINKTEPPRYINAEKFRSSNEMEEVHHVDLHSGWIHPYRREIAIPN